MRDNKFQRYKQRTLKYLAPLLLIIVASIQHYYVQNAQLSAWKGGGFGMFSTIDSPGNRVLSIQLITKRGTVPVNIPEDLQSLAGEARTYPTRKRLLNIAQIIGQKTWVPVVLENSLNHYENLLKNRMMINPKSWPGIQEVISHIDSIQLHSSTDKMDFLDTIDMSKFLIYRSASKDNYFSEKEKLHVLEVKISVKKPILNHIGPQIRLKTIREVILPLSK